MFSFILSVFVAAFIYGVVFNILRSFEIIEVNDNDEGFAWFIVMVGAAAWFISLPLLLLATSLYLIKIASDKVATLLLKKKSSDK